MDGPFIQAWALLKQVPGLATTPRSGQTRLDTAEGLRYLPVGSFMDRLEAKRDRKLLDDKANFKQELNQHVPRLHQNDQEDSGRKKYTVDVGPRSVGWVDVVNGGSLTTVGEGKVNPNAQRQGLYGRALQGIINDAGNLTSYERNENSQPFHEQFNPPNATKEIKGGDMSFVNYNDIHQYTAKPPQETPREFGDLQYDTGAMPVFNRGTEEAPLRTGEQQSIYEALNPFIPGGVNGQN